MATIREFTERGCAPLSNPKYVQASNGGSVWRSTIFLATAGLTYTMPASYSREQCGANVIYLYTCSTISQVPSGLVQALITSSGPMCEILAISPCACACTDNIRKCLNMWMLHFIHSVTDLACSMLHGILWCSLYCQCNNTVLHIQHL